MTFYNRYIPVEVRSIKCGAAEVSANEVEFELPYECQGVLAMVFLANGNYYATGLKTTFEEDDGQHKVKVDVTELNTDDIVSVVCFKAAAANKNPSGVYYDRYMPIEVHTKKASATEAGADEVVFDLPYECQGVIAQVVQTADDVVDITGAKATMVEDDGQHQVKVEVSSLAENDIVSVICFKAEGVNNASGVYYDKYMPFEVAYAKAPEGVATNNNIIFTFPYEVNGAIAQIRADADGTNNATGLKVEIDGKEVTVKADNITEDDHISVIAFK